MAKEKKVQMKNGQQKKKRRKRWPLLTIPVLLLLIAASGYYFFAPAHWPYSAKALREQKEKQLEQQQQSLAQKNAELRAALAEIENEKRQLELQMDRLNRQLAEQQAQIDEMRRAEQAEVFERLRNTARLFSDMSPSKAVAIMQAMPRSEAALILKVMSEKDRVRLLSRFEPETAAAFTLALQQIPPLDDASDIEGSRQQLAALLPEPPEEPATPPVTAEDMALTLATMDAATAAEMIAQWWSQDRPGTLAILRAMTPQSRAQVLSELEADVATEMGRQLLQNAS